jgi:hypothetical protein
LKLQGNASSNIGRNKLNPESIRMIPDSEYWMKKSGLQKSNYKLELSIYINAELANKALDLNAKLL